MGRKLQKTNRHKKLKAIDPFYTGDRKILIDKNLINANQVPEQNDNKLSSKQREILRYKEDRNKNNKVSDVLHRKPDEEGAEMPLRNVPELKKMTQESEMAFLNRIDREVDHVIHRSQYEDQFEVKLETKEDTVVIKKDKKMREAKRRSLNKLKDKLKAKKEDAMIERNNKKITKRDQVKFGEVVHHPPMITSFPKFSTKKYIDPNTPFTIPANTKTKHGITEKDRNEVIQQYRSIKKNANKRVAI